MTSTQAVNALQLVLPTLSELPPELVTRTSELYTLSQFRISLRPDEEAARSMLCAQLAVEHLRKRIDSLPMPETSRAPLPRTAYSRLLLVFRRQLATLGSSAPSTPSKLRTVSQPVTPLSTTKRELFKTPTKRSVSKSPSKTPSKSPGLGTPVKQFSGPSPSVADVDLMFSALGLDEDTQKAIAHGYNIYSKLVRERWGLFCGLVYVLAHRTGHKHVTAQLVLSHAHHSVTLEAVEQWSAFCEQIIGDQTWVRKLVRTTHINKPQTRLVNSVGDMLYRQPRSNGQDYDEWAEAVLERIVGTRE